MFINQKRKKKVSSYGLRGGNGNPYPRHQDADGHAHGLPRPRQLRRGPPSEGSRQSGREARVCSGRGTTERHLPSSSGRRGGNPGTTRVVRKWEKPLLLSARPPQSTGCGPGDVRSSCWQAPRWLATAAGRTSQKLSGKAGGWLPESQPEERSNSSDGSR